MANEEEKGKSCEDLWGIVRFYFICVLGAPYYQGGCIEWVGKVQIDKSILITYLPRKIWPPRLGSRGICRTCLPPAWTYSSLLFLPDSRAYLAPALGSREVCRRCPALGLDISGHPPRVMAKSLYWTYLGCFPGSRDDLRTYSIPRPDMSGPSAFNPG
jgi:hypothetical protein